MNPILSSLRIANPIQSYFESSFKFDDGRLTFCYGNTWEHFDGILHNIPITDECWINKNRLENVREIFVCSSALEAIFFLSMYKTQFKHMEHLCFVSLGLLPCEKHIEFLKSIYKNKKLSIIGGKDLLSKVRDIKIATAMSGFKVYIFLAGNEVEVRFRGNLYYFRASQLSLNSFEKKTRFRSHIRTYKPFSDAAFVKSIRDSS